MKDFISNVEGTLMRNPGSSRREVQFNFKTNMFDIYLKRKICSSLR